MTLFGFFDYELHLVSGKMRQSDPYGGVAQGLEHSAHNRLVAGSNPATPTK